MYAFDTETFLIGEQQQAPKLVCGSFYNPHSSPELYNREELGPILKSIIGKHRLVIHNASFDMAVILANYPELADQIFDAYDSKKIICTRVFEKLALLGTTGFLDGQKYDLATLVKMHLGKDISEEKKGQDVWRLRYSELDGLSVEEYPEEASRYAKQDAVLHWDLHQRQLEVYGDYIEDYWRQVSADFGLQLMTVCGIRLDREKVDLLSADIKKRLAAAMEKLIEEGIYVRKFKTKPGWKRDTAAFHARVEDAYDKLGKICPKTPKGKVATDKDALAGIRGADPILDLIIETNSDRHTMNNFIPALQGSYTHPSYDVLKTTGRTSSFKPNIQQMPRRGGVRECVIPRDGYLFCAIDYSTIELCALAYVTQQVLDLPDDELNMLKAINAGMDLHLVTAGAILDREYEDLLANKKEQDVKDARQLAKAVNFGCPGGLGAVTFCEYARANYQIEGLDEEQARDLISLWKSRYSEMIDYFKHVSDLEQVDGSFTVPQVGTDRVRRGATYTAACNTYFQGLVADGAKDAIIAVTKECYIDDKSIVHGCAPVAFIHDEIIFEIPETDAKMHTRIVKRLSQIMIKCMQRVMPTVRVDVEASLMRRWYKGAEPCFDENGNIIPWEPEDDK